MTTCRDAVRLHRKLERHWRKIRSGSDREADRSSGGWLELSWCEPSQNTIIGILMAIFIIIIILNYTFRLSWIHPPIPHPTPVPPPPPRTLPPTPTPLDIPFQYWFEHVTFRFLYVMFRLSTRISYRIVPGFTTDCRCDVWCLLYIVGSHFGNLFEMLVGL